MRVAIHQPQFLPWLGYLDKIDRSDIFVLLDNVQFKKNEWQNRNRVKTAQGWQWMTVPVLHRHLESIDHIEINNRVNWKRKHIQTLEINYSRASHFRDYIPFFRSVYKREWPMLSNLNRTVIEFMMDAFGIKRKVILSSDIETRQEPNERLIDICRAVEADTYLAGEGGKDYMDLQCFEKANIRVVFQSFHHPDYPQLHGSFLPGMSGMDLLFNSGPQSLSILRGGRKPS